MTAKIVTEQAVADSQARFIARHPSSPRLGPGGSKVLIDSDQQVYEPRTEAQIITFSCVVGGKGPTQHVSVLAGDGAPTLTGAGVGRWNQVTRPGSTSLTTFDGYDPYTMDVPIQFEAVAADYGDKLTVRRLTVAGASGRAIAARAGASAKAIEAQITTLASFWNRGPKAAHAGRGVPPLVVVSATTSKAGVPLVPQEVAGVDWVISGIAWDANPLRNADGFRIRQLGVVSLMQYISGPFDASNNSTARRARQRQADAGRFKTVGMRKGESYFGLARRIGNGKDAETAAKAIETLNKTTHGAPHGSIHKGAAKVLNVRVPLAIFEGISP